MVQGSSLVAICVCKAKEHVSYHLHALHHHLILTRGSGAVLAALERVSGLSYLSDTNVDLLRGEETAVSAVGGEQQQHSMDQISRLLGRPKCSSGREDDWHDWKFGAIAATLSDHASVWMNGTLQHTTEITLDEASARIFARHMYTLLIHLCEGRALAIVRGAPDDSGLEAWRLLHEWYQPRTRSRGLALLNEILGWDFGTKEQFLQRVMHWENATLEYNRTASAPLQEEVLVAVLISRSPKEVRTYLHVQVLEETARLSHVRQLLYDYLRAGKAWKAPRTEEFGETNHSNVVPMDFDSVHRKGGKGKKGKGKGKNKGDRPRHDGKGKGEQSVKQRYFDRYCNQCCEYGHKKPDCAGKNKFFNGTCNKCGAHWHKSVDCPVKTVAHLESESVIEPNEGPTRIECLEWHFAFEHDGETMASSQMRLFGYFWIADLGCQLVLLSLPLTCRRSLEARCEHAQQQVSRPISWARKL